MVVEQDDLVLVFVRTDKNLSGGKQMKSKRIFCTLLSVLMLLGLLSGCGNTTNTSDLSTSQENINTSIEEEINNEPIPEDEYERGVWYGFLPDDLKEADPHSTVMTWKQYCSMLGNMINKLDSNKLTAWEDMTNQAPDTQMNRDGGMISLLFAAKTLGMLEFNSNYSGEYEAYVSKLSDVVSMDYPVFDWNAPFEISDTCKDSNAVKPAFDYCVCRVSAFNAASLFECDENGDWFLNQPFMMHDAMMSVVRLYESDLEVTNRYLNSSIDNIATEEEISAIYTMAEERKEAILNSPTTIVKSDTYIMGETYTGTAYYVSNNGDNNNDGLSEQTPFANMDVFEHIKLEYGDAIFFERGSIWRGDGFPYTVREIKGITFSAYGEGPKPAFYGSEESGVGSEKWELYYSDDSGKKIWKFYNVMPETGSIVLNGEEVVHRDIAWWDGTSYHELDESHEELIGENYDVTLHLPDMWCFPEIQYGDIAVENVGDRIYQSWDNDGNPIFHRGSLYFRCDKGNPGELYEEIEFISPYSINDGMTDDQVYDNICTMYGAVGHTTGYNGIKEGCSGVIQNCEVAWMGGQVFSYVTGNEEGDTRITLNYTLYGRNGGNLAVNGSDYTIKNNYIHDSYQEGISLETFEHCESMCNNVVSGNLIEHATQGILICNWDMEVNENHIHKNILIENNFVLDCGVNNLFSSDYENNYCNAVVFQGGPCANEDLYIRNNIFAFATGALIQIGTYSEEYSKVFENNTYVQYLEPNDEMATRGIGLDFYLYRPVSADSISEFLGDETGTALQYSQE